MSRFVHSWSAISRSLPQFAPARRPHARRRLMRPTLLALEERELLSTIVVNNPTDTPVAGQIDLRQAIGQANTNGGNETITFDKTVFMTPQTITLSGTQLGLSDTTGTETITGPKAGVTVSAGGASQVFQVGASVTASISGMTITGGNAGSGNGGGIDNSGTLTVSDCTFTNNSANGGPQRRRRHLQRRHADGEGQHLHRQHRLLRRRWNRQLRDSNGHRQHAHQQLPPTTAAAASTTQGRLTVGDSTLSGNSAGEFGGGILNINGTLTVIGSTFTSNSAGSYGGGGIYNYNILNGTATVIGSTFTSNSATYYGGGIYSDSTLTVIGSTFTSNSAGSYGGGIVQRRHADGDRQHLQQQHRAYYGGGMTTSGR